MCGLESHSYHESVHDVRSLDDKEVEVPDIADLTDDLVYVQELNNFFDEIGHPFNEKIRSHLLDVEGYDFDNRKGSGFTRASRALAGPINGPRNKYNVFVLEQEYDSYDLSEKPEDYDPRQELPEEKIRKGVAGLPEESKKVGEMVADILFSTEIKEGDVILPPIEKRKQVGNCTTAELYFLEYADGIVEYKRPNADFNIVTDQEGQPLMIEKMAPGEQSAITLKETVLNDVRLPAGTLVALDHRKDLEGIFSINDCDGVQYLRLTTLAVSPESRARAFGKHYLMQKSAQMTGYDRITIDDFKDQALKKMDNQSDDW